MALQRLCAPGSDLAGSAWVKTVEAPGFEDLALQHFYRTAAFLAGVREDLESKLFRRDLNLFNQTLDVVFIDTTSLYVTGIRKPSGASGATPGTIGRTCPSGCCAWR